MAVVLITGANRGIGLELARQYAAAGHDVIRCARGADPEGLGALGERIDCDVGDDASVAKLAQSLAGRPIDILINNAGIYGPKQQSTTEMDFAGFAEALNVNTLGPLRVTQALLPNLRASAAPKIAVISSKMGSFGNLATGAVAYRASKAAVNKVIHTIASDLAEEGIAIASFHPGWVQTDMGGAGAEIPATDSARGIIAVIDGLDVAHTGRFYQWNGEELPW
jgi:NAD(P)-dependent dehydrogenase (short-subunit alcohol dehydrogenase family)